jgi:hypothetical protein
VSHGGSFLPSVCQAVAGELYTQQKAARNSKGKVGEEKIDEIVDSICDPAKEVRPPKKKRVRND